MKHKIAIIVPTKDHPDDLRKLLISFRGTTRKPDQIIIVDGSDKPVEELVKEYADLPVDYLRCVPPGLTKQRNFGLRNVREEITLVGYLDDDIVVEQDAIKNLLLFWENASDKVGGTSFNITNNAENPYNWFTYIFGTNRGKKGVILKSGFNVILYPVERDTKVEWLCGGATVWRKEILNKMKYDEWFAGCSYIEDIDYSFRVGKEYEMYVVKDARIQHFQNPIPAEKQLAFSKANVIGRYYFISKHPCYFSKPYFFWAVFGQTAYCLMSGVLKRDREHFNMFLGWVHGLFNLLIGKREGVNAQK